jgi:hypothetical protein
VYESAGVQPVFVSEQQAIDYATGRAFFRSGEIRILACDGGPIAAYQAKRYMKIDHTDPGDSPPVFISESIPIKRLFRSGAIFLQAQVSESLDQSSQNPSL